MLARFIGNEKLFYALATYSNGDSTPQLTSVPSEASPYINVRGLSGRSLRRVGLLPSRQRAASAYGGGNELEWAGDMLMPGTQAAGPSPAETNGKSNGAAPAPATEAAAFEYRDGFGEMPAPSRQATARAQADECYSLNWDDVQLIPQPTGQTCWAAAGAMVVGWYEQKSLGSEEIASICGRSMTTGLSKDERRKFASEIGLVAEEPQSYTPDALRSLLRTYGPLWVSVQIGINGHAIVVTGMYSDGTEGGSDVYVRITDPWDRVVGTPGAPGGYLSSHNTGSRYIMSWADFTAEYEARASTAPDGTVNAQILHAPKATKREPNYYRAKGYAMSAAYTPSARAMTGQSPDTNWGKDTQPVPEVPGASCWAAAMSMVVGWRDSLSIDPTDIVRKAEGRDDRASLAAAWNLGTPGPASYTALEMAQMLQAHGPLWVATRQANDPHAFVIFQICGDGTPDGTFVYIVDPWGNVPGSPRAPGSNPTPGQGSNYSLSYREFAGQYDPSGGPTSSPNATHADVQLIYSQSVDTTKSLPIDCSNGLIPLSSPQGLRTTARAQSKESFSLNWGKVPLVAQPTRVSCWAAAAAMVLGWRDEKESLTADDVALIAGRSTADDLDPPQVGPFAGEVGLTYEHPQSYTIDSFRTMLETYGPLWVGSAVPGLHAIVVTGMYSDGAPDGSDTYLRITDPWDRVRGTPGAPGGYLDSHLTGSRYIMSWAQFVSEYESAARVDRVNLQILHADCTDGRTPSKSGVGAGYAMSAGSAARYARAQSSESYTLNWDKVDLIPQPTDYSCWAAAAAMVIGWREGDKPPLSADKIAEYCGRSISGGLPADSFRAFGQKMGLTAAPPQCYTPDGLRNLLENYGPVWVGVQLPGSGHAIVVTGMYSDGAEDGSDTYVRITDPWDRVEGTPGAPGGYLSTHDTGSRYIMNWADFTAEYEGFASSAADGTVNAQILHSGSNRGRKPNTSGAAGYAMSLEGDCDQTLLPPPPPILKSEAMDAATVVSAIAGAIVPIVNQDGNIKWTLDQFRGIKHPNDIAPSSPAQFWDAPTIRLNEWPFIDILQDRISAWFSVDFQCNGQSLGNVRITNTGTNDSLFQKLQVEARIMDDNIVYPRKNPTYAALRIRFHYRFTPKFGSDWIAITDLHLLGNGKYESSSRWEQE